MAFEDKAVRTVIAILYDGEMGFRSLSTRLKEPRLKALFSNESATRGTFATELEMTLGLVKGEEVNEGGTASGALHRTWAELKARLGGSDQSLLETAEQGEDTAKKAYEDVLKLTNIPAPIRTLLQEQQTHILQSHSVVQSMQDALAVA